MINLYLSCLNTIMDVVKLDVDVLAMAMVDGVLAQSNGVLVVDEQLELGLRIAEHLTDQARQPYALARCSRRSNILNLA